MREYDELVLKCFIRQQGQLFPEDVVSNPDEADAFLEECMAVVVDSAEEVREYFEEEGVDIEPGEDILMAAEVFEVGDGRYLIVEG